jgi:hypothetical protein
MVLPNELVVLITAFVGGAITWLVVEGFKGFSEALGKDLSTFAKVAAGIISASAVTAIIALANAALGFVPVEYQPLAAQILSLIVMVFGAMGIQRKVKAKG